MDEATEEHLYDLQRRAGDLARRASGFIYFDRSNAAVQGLLDDVAVLRADSERALADALAGVTDTYDTYDAIRVVKLQIGPALDAVTAVCERVLNADPPPVVVRSDLDIVGPNTAGGRLGGIRGDDGGVLLDAVERGGIEAALEVADRVAQQVTARLIARTVWR